MSERPEDILEDYFPFKVERIAKRLKEAGVFDDEVRFVFEQAVIHFERNDAAFGNLCAALIKVGRYERQRDNEPISEYERHLWEQGYREESVKYLEDIVLSYFSSTMDILQGSDDEASGLGGSS